MFCDLIAALICASFLLGLVHFDQHDVHTKLNLRENNSMQNNLINRIDDAVCYGSNEQHNNVLVSFCKLYFFSNLVEKNAAILDGMFLKEQRGLNAGAAKPWDISHHNPYTGQSLYGSVLLTRQQLQIVLDNLEQLKQAFNPTKKAENQVGITPKVTYVSEQALSSLHEIIQSIAYGFYDISQQLNKDILFCDVEINQILGQEFRVDNNFEQISDLLTRLIAVITSVQRQAEGEYLIYVWQQEHFRLGHEQHGVLRWIDLPRPQK